MGKKKKKTQYAWNVMSEEEFRKRLVQVFEMVSGAIINTLGPYGSQIIIDQFGEHHITKDGWSVLKRFRFRDEEGVLNSILNLITRIAGPVVANVGDGSSSSIAMSNFLYRQMCHADEVEKNGKSLASLRPKEKQDALQKASQLIQDEIQRNAKQIDREGDLEEIYKLAYVSTNGNEEVSRMIQDIYKKTGNPTIYYKEAKGSETSYEITEGYKLRVSLLDNLYINTDDGNCEIHRPYILAFDHKIGAETYPAIIHEARLKASEEGRKLVVIAPYYNRNLLIDIGHQAKYDVANYGTTEVIYCVASTGSNVLTNFYHDFVMLTGAKMFTEIDFAQREKAIEHLRNIQEASKEGKEPIERDEALLSAAYGANYLGEVDSISINHIDCTANGFYKKNEALYKIHLQDAKAKYQEVRDRNLATNQITVEEYDLKQRVSKLSCSMGTILVGGSTSIERRSNYDLVEDAVKAAESAYTYGYNIGGNLAIVSAANTILEERHRVANYTDPFEIAVTILVDHIKVAASKVYRAVLTNKYNENLEADRKELSNIMAEGLDGRIYNLLTNRYDDEEAIINSCRTDIEILKASVGIVSLLLSSSLFLTIDPNQV